MFSARPWVADVSVTFELDEEEPVEDDTDTGMVDNETKTPVTTGAITVSFSTDEMGQYSVVVGGDWRTQGTTIDEGELSTSGQHILSIPIDTSDEMWADGENPIYVFVTSNGFTGHGRDAIQLESAPGQVSLTSSNIGFEDGALILSFTELNDEDIEYYSVYVTVTEFSADAFQSGGPAFDGVDALSAPLVVSSVKPGGEILQRIEPLTNDVTYYVAVRAMDKSGLEGPMSTVVSERPRPSYNATDLSSDPGGFSCAAGGAMTLGWLGVLPVLVRRRRCRGIGVGMALMAALGIGAMATPNIAEAKEPRRDDTAQWGQFEARYGPVWLKDQRITEIYSGSFDAESEFNHVGQALQFEVGAPIF